MKKTLAFAGLEVRAIKPYRVSVLLLLVFALGMGAYFKSNTSLFSYLLMVLVLLMSYPFSINERSGLDTLYSTLAIGRKTVVRGRYVFAVMAEAVCMALALLLSLGLSAWMKTDFNIAETLFSLSVLSGVFSLLASLQFPVYFKYGYSKAKLLGLIPLLIVFLVFIQLPLLTDLLGMDFSWSEISFAAEDIPTVLYLAPVAAGFILLWLSCMISCRLYTNRDL
jgi:ABC-2 type transport system permease protein